MLFAELQRAGEQLVTTRFTSAELYVGAELADRPERDYEAIQRALSRLGILDFDDRAARRFGQIVAVGRRAGRMLPPIDALIAAVAQVNGHSIVTSNPQHFERVPGLVVHGY